MPKVTVERDVSIQDTAVALREKLGGGYEVSSHGQGGKETLRVKESAASVAIVRLDHQENRTTFHVRGGGFLISRLINELGVAKRVARALESALGSAPDSQGA